MLCLFGFHSLEGKMYSRYAVCTILYHLFFENKITNAIHLRQHDQIETKKNALFRYLDGVSVCVVLDAV